MPVVILEMGPDSYDSHVVDTPCKLKVYTGEKLLFQGSIPQDVRSILFEATRGWDSRRIAVACSGNFTVERVLHEHNRFDIAGCDVSIYSCALGAWFARQPFDLTLRDDYH